MSAPASDPRRTTPRRRLGDWVADVDARTLRGDATAAVLAAVLVLPQAIAFAAVAGLPPAWGIYSAIVPTFVAALAGSSRHVLTGPTNALSLALAASLAPLAAAGSAEYLRLALVVTLMVGAIQLALALLRWSALTHFIAPSVLLGFTTGAALLIAWGALRAIGLRPTPDAAALAVGGTTLAVAAALHRVWPRGPVMLLALAGGSVASVVLPIVDGAALARVGALPQPWPPFGLPPVVASDVPRLATIALALTIVAIGQSVAVAKTLAERSGQAIDVDRECFGQGLANTVGAFFSCFAVCASFNRSLPHLAAGARTPLAGGLAAVGLLALVALAADWLAWVPMAAIAALLLVVAWRLVDRAAWRDLWRIDRRDAAVAGGTLVATLVLPLQVAVLAGVAASLVLYLHRTAHPALRTMGFDRPPGVEPRPFVVVDPDAPQPRGHGECPQLKLLRMEGSVWFGAVAHVGDVLHALHAAPTPPRHLLVMAKSMNFVDAAGAALWERERLRRRAAGGDLYFHRPRPEVLRIWRAGGFVEQLGADHLYADKRSAIAAIVPRLDGAICAGCRQRVFAECARQPGGERGDGIG